MNKLFFENLFIQQEDPWFINSRLSQHKRYLYVITILQKYTPYAKTILDVGCALGTFTNVLAQYFPTSLITGIDIAPEAIRKAKINFPHLSFEVQALPNLKHNAESFDVICALEVIYYLTNVTDQIEALKTCHRLLKKDGIIIISTSCDPTSVSNYDTLLKPIDLKLFSIEHRSFTYGHLFFRLEAFLIHIYDICSYFKNKNKFFTFANMMQFFIKKTLHSSLLFYALTLPARIIRRKPLHQILVLKKI